VSSNKKVVESYMASMSRMDRPAVLSCLTDDVEWSIVTAGERMRGKEEFRDNIGDPATMGDVRIEVARMTEENDVVVAEGTVRVSPKQGDPVTFRFCDVFEFESTKVKRLTTFTAQVGTST
jgi:ketosteroid isomerase-like protein